MLVGDAGHFSCETEEKAAMARLDFSEDAAKTHKEPGFLAGAAEGLVFPHGVVPKLWRAGRLLDAAEQFMERKAERASPFFQSGDAGDGVTIFDAGNIAAEESSARFYIQLRAVF